MSARDVLADIKARVDESGRPPGSYRSAADVPRLVAAVEAVLDLHHPVHIAGAFDDWCEVDGDPWPCPTFELVTTLLEAS